MTIALLPFSATRSDRSQGIYARQIPALLATLLTEAGVQAVVRPWLARSGSRVAHVIVEGQVPASVALAEAREANAEHLVVGTSRVSAIEVHVDAEVLDVASGEKLRNLGVDEPGQQLVEAIATLASALLDRPVDAEAIGTADPQALRAWLFDMDNAALVDAGGLDALNEPTDGFRHLVDALQADADFARARGALDERLERWTERNPDVALLAAIASAERLDGGEQAWAQAVTLAQRVEDREAEETALRALTKVAADPSRARLTLGVFLIQQRRAVQALAPLREAANDPLQRDAAETYLGVALASVGEVDEAITYWSRVVEEGTDRRIVRIAEENLHRARTE